MSETLNKTNEAKIRDTLVKHPDCFFCPESVEQMLATITALRARVAELEGVVAIANNTPYPFDHDLKHVDGPCSGTCELCDWYDRLNAAISAALAAKGGAK